MPRIALFLAVVSCAAGVAFAQDASLNETDFFEALDLSRPDMAAVRAVFEKGDLPAARAAFVAHLKQRETPKWYFDWRDRPPATDPSGKAKDQAANDALEHRFTVISIPHTFEGEIDWSYNPTTAPGTEFARNHEWTWQFSRHPFWASLGRAYWDTGNETYAREFVAQMTHWVEKNPVPEPSVDQKPFSRWRTIEAGIRMGGSWPDSFYYFLSSPSFTDDAILTMVRSMAEHARYLRAHPTVKNWLTMEMNGLYTVGTLFPEFREAAEWRAIAAARIREELDAQVYPDGAQTELAPGYHWVALRNMRAILALAQLNDQPLPDGFLESFERMYDYGMWLMTPDRGLPPFNDSGNSTGAVISWLKDGLDYFPNREDWRWVVTDGKEGAPPGHTSHAFNYAGYIAQRSGWDRGARYLAFDAGPFGSGHQHEDKLNIVLSAYGRHLLVEGGIYTYDASQWRKYVLSPYAHNVAFIDGLGQNRHGLHETYESSAPLPFAWETNDAYDYAQASYGGEFEGFGKGRTVPAVHTRGVLFVKRGPAAGSAIGDFWVVADTFTPQDDAAHTYETVFHLDAPDATVDAQTKSVHTTYEDGANLGIYPMPVDGLDVRIVSGQEEPEVQGWLPAGGINRLDMRPIPTPIYSVNASGIVSLLYVFYPVPEGAPPAVTVSPWTVEGATVAAEVAFADGPRYRVSMPQDGGPAQLMRFDEDWTTVTP